MRHTITLTEAPILVDNFTVHGSDTEVFRDPTSLRDMVSTLGPRRKQKAEVSFRALVTDTTVYYWDEYASALHTDISHRLGIRDTAFPAYLYLTPLAGIAELAVAWNSIAMYRSWSTMAPQAIVDHAQHLLTTNPSLRALRTHYNSETDDYPLKGMR